MKEEIGSMGASPDRIAGPRVLLDGYFIDRRYGFGRYVRELVHSLQLHQPDIDLTVLVPPRGEATARSLVSGGKVLVATERFFPLWEQWTVPRVARSSVCDLVHFPYQTMAVGWPSGAAVMTVHDLMPFAPDNWRDWSIDRVANRYRRWVLRSYGKRAAQILTVSDATQHALHAMFGRDSVVAPCTVDHFVQCHRRDDVVAESRGGTPYFLHRGGEAVHKNTRRVIEAFGHCRTRVPDVELRIFGIDPRGGFARDNQCAGVHFLDRVSDAELAALYASARAFVMPSLEEGFGLGILEAFNFGAAVITSNRAPMSDIAGGCAVIVDPESTSQLTAALQLMATDAERQRSLRARGLERAAAFSGQAIASRVAQTYRAVAAARH